MDLETVPGGQSSSALIVRQPVVSDHERILRHAISDMVREGEILPGHLQQTYLLSSANRSRSLLKSAPPPLTRLMRHEGDTLEVEAKVLQLSPVSRWSPSISKSPPCLLINIGDSVPFSKLGKLNDARSVILQRNLWLLALSLNRLTNDCFGPLHLTIHGQSSPSWRVALTHMVDAVLLDAEDLLINVPYHSIRHYLQQYASTLDGIKDPSLVLLDCFKKDNLLVEPMTLRVTGFIENWSAVWGDPELAYCGLGSDCFADAAQTLLPKADENAQVRRLLYTVYRSLLVVVAFCYRPVEDNLQELEARQMLTQALDELDDRSIAKRKAGEND